MAKIILCRGIQGSGKTTWAKQYCKEHPNTIRVNRDDIRQMFSQKWSKELEQIVIDTELRAIDNALYEEMDVVVDDVSNLNKYTVDKIWDIVRKYQQMRSISDYGIIYQDFFIPLQDCIERDSKRPNPIGEEVIRKTYEKYKDILKV
jgi:tRNA uridine 5-carbamoylmethylation protein Kti12